MSALLGLLSTAALAASVTFNPSPASGTYTVPTGVNQITIIARGADGGLATASAVSNPGQGATVTTVITVAPGDVVRFVVGSTGANGDLESGGGGGTGVFINGVLSMVAGGGGGEDNTGDGDGGQAGLNGTSVGANAGTAGIGGNGGGGGGGNAGDGGGGGGGILSAGGNVNSAGPSLTTGGAQADTNLGDGLTVSAGGTSNQTTDPAGADGLGASGGAGFGGGGAGSHRESGAGGGYSGGGGGGSSGRPGGGGSYQNTAVAGYVSGTITAGTSGGGVAANGFVSISYVDPQITVSKISSGGTGTFAFTGSNGFGGHSIATVTPGVAVPGPTQILASPGISTTVTESAPPAGFALTAIACSGMGIGGTATPNLATRTVTFNPAATVSGSNISCTFTNTRSIIKFRKITLNGTGGPFTFTTPFNIASAPAAITTVTTGVAEPVAPAVITITALNSQVQLTEAATSGFFINSVSCSDANSAVTGNTGAIGTLTGSTLTIPGPNVKAGVDFTCTFTNTKLVPAMTVVKSANTAGPVAAGTTIIYTFKVKNTGNTSIAGVNLTDAFNGYGTAPIPRNETLTLDAAPTGDSSNGAVDDGIWANLGPGDEVTFTAPYMVTQSDIDFRQ